MTDLTDEILDELEANAIRMTSRERAVSEIRTDIKLALVAMARRTLEAERYSNRTRLDLEGMSTALALAERDRDEMAQQLTQQPGIDFDAIDEMFGTCDWGDCDQGSVGIRWHREGRMFLPVCETHIATTGGDA